jgi:hypothetical protein
MDILLDLPWWVQAALVFLYTFVLVMQMIPIYLTWRDHRGRRFLPATPTLTVHGALPTATPVLALRQLPDGWLVSVQLPWSTLQVRIAETDDISLKPGDAPSTDPTSAHAQRLAAARWLVHMLRGSTFAEAALHLANPAAPTLELVFDRGWRHTVTLPLR